MTVSSEGSELTKSGAPQNRRRFPAVGPQPSALLSKNAGASGISAALANWNRGNIAFTQRRAAVVGRVGPGFLQVQFGELAPQ
jgi:hypothetical protein